MSWLNQITSQIQSFANGLDQEGNPTAGNVLAADAPIDVKALLEERSRLQDSLLQLDSQYQEERSQMILIKDDLQARLQRAEAELNVLRSGGAPAADHEVDLEESWGDDWGDGGESKQKLDESSHHVVELQKSLDEAQRQLASVTELKLELHNLKHENILLKNKLEGMQEENEMLELELESRGSASQAPAAPNGHPEYDYEGFCKDVVTTLLGGTEFSAEKIKEARDGLKQLSSKVQSFEEKTESVAESLEELEDQRNAIRAEKAALEEELRRLSEVEVELKQVRSQLKKATDDKSSLSTKVEKSMRSQAELKAQIAELSKATNTGSESARVAELEAALQSERQTAEATKLEFESFKKSAETGTENLRNQLQENGTRIAELEASLESMKNQLDSSSDREASLAKEVQDLRASLTQNVAAETDDLKIQLQTCKDRLAEYESSWEQLRTQYEMSSNREAALMQEVQNLQSLLSELQNRNESDHSESSRLLKQTRDQESEIQQLRAEVSIANEQLVECQQKIAELENALPHSSSSAPAATEAAEEVAGLRQRLETSEQELELLRHSRDSVVNELEAAENYKQQLLAQITSSQQELEAMKMVKQSRDQSLEQLASEKKQMITVVNEKARENADLQSRLNGLMGAINDEKQARAKLEQQYADYQQRVKIQIEQYEQQIVQQREMLQQQGEQMLVQQQLHQQQQELQHEQHSQRTDTPPIDVSPYQNKISALEFECQNVSRTLAHKNEENTELRQRIQRLLENESKMKLEIQRLTSHLVEVEETYTKEALTSEQRTKALQQRLTLLEESARNTDSSAQAITAQASQKAEMLEAELVQALSERDEARDQVSTLEDQIQRSAVNLASLQIALEHMQSAKDNGTKSMRKHTEAELKKLSDRIVELETALAAKEETLNNMSETVEATSKLTQQLQDKNTTLSRLQQKLNEKEQELQRALERCRRSEGAEGKVEKQLIKNMLLGYFTAAPDKKTDVMRCITGYLEFTEDENRRLSSGGPRGLFGIFGGSQAAPQDANDSFTNQLIAYIEKESTPSTPLRLSTEPAVDRLRKVSSSSCPPEQTQRQLSSSPFRPDNPLFSHLPTSPIAPSSASSQASTTSEPEVLREILAQPSGQP